MKTTVAVIYGGRSGEHEVSIASAAAVGRKLTIDLPNNGGRTTAAFYFVNGRIVSLDRLAEMYADPKIKVTSFWTMGFNQHTRGTWVNEQAYMVHLLTGKQAKPGNGAFSLTGQPSACGTALLPMCSIASGAVSVGT